MSRSFVLVLIISLASLGCGQKEEAQVSEQEAQLQKELEDTPDEMLSSFSVSGYARGGKRQWDLAGKSADIMAEEIKLLDVRGKVYGKETNMTIVADQGSLNRANNNVHLEKNVQVSTDDGATLNTDYLDWDAQNQRLSNEDPVWIERDRMKAKGVGIIAQPALNKVEIKKDVTVELSIKEDDAPTVITCDGSLEVEYERNLAIFEQNVIVKDMRGEILADKMDLYLARQTQEGKKIEGMQGMGIDKVVAEGNVEIHRGENISFSEKAVYDTETGKLTLTGKPKLVIYSTEDFAQLVGTSDTESEEK